MQSSLDALSGNLTDDQFRELAKVYSGNEFTLLKLKGIFPYDYVSSVEKLAETSLPPKEAFYSKLTGKAICNDDYEFANKVWKAFGCKTIRN